ncbi:MAG TPA: SRPBCC family protein [Acidothermaceae bacterium]|nr:SRPBCC family protein [Acidothermaceae bacterium]
MTTQAATRPPAATTVQVYQVLIRATPQQIWDAITKPEFTSRYFHGALVSTTGEAGTPFRYYAPDGVTLWGDETILESDPPRRLVVPWRSLYDEEMAQEPPSRVTWEIEDQGNGVCLLTATHDQLDASPKTAQSVSGIGWLTVVSGLKTLLETGEPLFATA